jgi:hypothetical protein
LRTTRGPALAATSCGFVRGFVRGFMRPRAQVVSRVLTIYTGGEGVKYLIPMVDFFNHDPASANTLKCSGAIPAHAPPRARLRVWRCTQPQGNLFTST